MPPTRTLQALLAAAQSAAAEQEQAAARIAARCAWAKQAVAAFMAAQERVQEAWERIFDALPDDIDEEALDQLPDPPEQAEADALWAEIEAVRDHDRWPRHLHWTL
jgi:predicted O-linked N-acetylglucosamine transferase (SPINDLY family)